MCRSCRPLCGLLLRFSASLILASLVEQPCEMRCFELTATLLLGIIYLLNVTIKNRRCVSVFALSAGELGSNLGRVKP